jgi:hypothetical protein
MLTLAAIGEGVKEIKSSSIEQFPNAFKNLPEVETDNKKDIDQPIEYKDTSDTGGQTEKLNTINERYEDKVDPHTGVPFERQIIEVSAGNKVEGVFPRFESNFDAQLPPELYKETDYKQFKECNNQLKNDVSKNPNLEKGFNKEQLEQIKNGDTPDGYVWHHDAIPGKMQLVDYQIHADTRHTGGKVVWGGGNENR